MIIDIHTHILEMGLQKQEGEEIIDTDEPMKRNIVLWISTPSEDQDWEGRISSFDRLLLESLSSRGFSSDFNSSSVRTRLARSLSTKKRVPF